MEDYDVKIIVGKEPNIEEFKAHSTILSSKSIYFKNALSSRWVKKEDGIIIFYKPNISPLVFEVLIKHIYKGILSVENNGINLMDVIIAADELKLLEVYQQLENRFLDNKLNWKPKEIITALQHDRFTNLYNFALGIIYRNPIIIFESEDFSKIKEVQLIQLLKSDDLVLKEIKIWKYLIKWGIKNTDSISDDDLTKWTSKNFVGLKNTLRNCIPHIRFFSMSPNEYTKATRHFKDILPDGLDEEVLQYFLDPTSKLSFDVLPLRGYPFDSNIINAKDAALIASWVHKKRTPYNNYKDLPSKFKLIYRASRDGFGINNFHKNCDNKESTVIIIKIRNSGEIIGGYNPLEWRSIKIEENETSRLLSHNQDFYNDYKCKASNSFIFSLTNQKFPILSRISSKEEAIIWCKNKGPCFGLQDLCIKPLKPSNNFNVICESKQHSYEKKIINGEIFEIEEYEVFQVDKGFSHKMFQFIAFIYKDKIDEKVAPFRVNVKVPDQVELMSFIYFILFCIFL
uniref:Serine-enriched protein n=1 Tax=Rhizophagus irregularis (strain DAOM 181602 / DAOM 197198 / MUCL 43194) TaxID=747089 RepID=U9TNG6_RHIID